MAENEKRWYVIHTYSGHEDRVKKNLEQRIKEFRKMNVPSFNKNSSTRKYLEILYTQLITPLKEYLTSPVIGIIPHGVLHYLPFAALTDGNHYLHDEYTLFFLPSTSVLKFVQEKRKSEDSRVLAMANSR